MLSTFRKSPFTRFLIFYIAGILYAYYHYAGSRIHIFLTFFLLLLLFILLFAVCRNPRFHTNWLSGILAGALLFIIGTLNMGIHLRYGMALEKMNGFKGSAMMEVLDLPVETEKSQKVIMQIRYLHSQGVWQNHRQKIITYIEKDSSSKMLQPGDRVLAYVNLKAIEPPRNPGEFNYKRYLAARLVYSQTYIDSQNWRLMHIQAKGSLKVHAANMQQKLLKEYQKIGLNARLYSILSALTLGYKSDLEAQTKQIFSRAGVMHVMALSGFNVAVIAAALTYLLFFTDRFRYGKTFRTILVIFMIWLFVFITGLSASVTRAAVMITLVLTGSLIQRRINTTNILAGSAFILLTVSPSLISDISFQLSFSAVFGIVVFHPVLYRLVKFRYIVTDAVWKLFTVSFAAQLTTLPLTLYYFHQFPVYFWLTNLYVVPLVSIIICVAGLFLILSSIHPIMIILGKVLNILLTILYTSVSSTEFLPFALIENIHISLFHVALIILLIMVLNMYLLQRRLIYVYLALSTFMTLQIANIFKVYDWSNQKICAVGSCKGLSAISLISGRDCLLLTDKEIECNDPVIQYAFQNFWIQHGVASSVQLKTWQNAAGNTATGLGNNLLFDFSGKKIMILNDNSICQLKSNKPFRLDILVITNNIKSIGSPILELFDPDIVVIDPSVKGYISEGWKEFFNERERNFWIVNKQGAYVEEF